MDVRIVVADAITASLTNCGSEKSGSEWRVKTTMRQATDRVATAETTAAG